MKKTAFAIVLALSFSAHAEQAKEIKQNSDPGEPATEFRTTKNFEGRFWANGSWMIRPKAGGIVRTDGETMSVYCIDGVKMFVSNENRQSYAAPMPGFHGFQPCTVESASGGEIQVSTLPKNIRQRLQKPFGGTTP